MIPKIIHYCWLSNDPVPSDLQKYMQTWKVKLPDYEFIKWDFKRFPKGKSKWVDQAFDKKKYAFAAYGGAFNRSGCFVLCRRLFEKECRSEAKRTDLA